MTEIQAECTNRLVEEEVVNDTLYYEEFTQKIAGENRPETKLRTVEKTVAFDGVLCWRSERIISTDFRIFGNFLICFRKID